MKKIPSEWTKKMFLSASWYALMYGDADTRHLVGLDLHDIALYGFSNWRNGESGKYSVDYTKFKTDLFLS